MTQDTAKHLQSDLNLLAQKIGELEAERDEHILVTDTLAKCEPDRVCYRLIDQVLVQQPVCQVLPLLAGNLEGIKGMMRHLGGQYKTKEEEMLAVKSQGAVKA